MSHDYKANSGPVIHIQISEQLLETSNVRMTEYAPSPAPKHRPLPNLISLDFADTPSVSEPQAIAGPSHTRESSTIPMRRSPNPVVVTPTTKPGAMFIRNTAARTAAAARVPPVASSSATPSVARAGRQRSPSVTSVPPQPPTPTSSPHLSARVSSKSSPNSAILGRRSPALRHTVRPPKTPQQPPSLEPQLPRNGEVDPALDMRRVNHASEVLDAVFDCLQKVMFVLEAAGDLHNDIYRLQEDGAGFLNSSQTVSEFKFVQRSIQEIHRAMAEAWEFTRNQVKAVNIHATGEYVGGPNEVAKTMFNKVLSMIEKLWILNRDYGMNRIRFENYYYYKHQRVKIEFLKNRYIEWHDHLRLVTLQVERTMKDNINNLEDQRCRSPFTDPDVLSSDDEDDDMPEEVDKPVHN